MIAENLTRSVLQLCLTHKLKVATVESCTGGLIAAALTDIAGSSEIFDRGFVTYSNEAKASMVGVPASLIREHGAVSKEVALAMATGGLKHSEADIAIAVTGIAGPSGGSEQKPIGLVHLAVASTFKQISHVEAHFGAKSRACIRRLTVEKGLELIVKYIGSLSLQG